MQNEQTRRIPLGVIATLSAVVVAAGGGTAWWAVNSQKDLTLNGMNPVPTQPQDPGVNIEVTQDPTVTPPTALNPVEQSVQIYLVQDTGTQFELASVPVSVQATEQPEAVLKAAFDRLVTQPPNSGGFSAIPPGTQVLNVEVKQNGIYVNLSPEFTSGGGSSSMTARLGQVVYTATTLDPNASVWISVGGEPLEVLGGEGLEIPVPITRTIFESEFPL
ncbi:GerMN domain-containing protein [Laspinema olomoucense]|uniref:GerMN domain-containing protein n=1 Tax=Laspinema olomoucense D3b TaxID=2953688 RepID=A0ABT2N6D2_9CYAN|nr:MULTISPECIES: GerMN domain-containing protein [unclassified Laspinema]MCT7970580.1 GerMN domain-containing protein [Laspinema sp. D3d]MCT7976925.1 GerMN domain-containing protein [Laspinema sp. D3b]MCT7989561.1 GerMN domain-containing protein [Laspinema sp. D3a]MCT7996838.1 GerMN domain-containing protein [Laspinema sp. D3c]